MYMFVLTLIVAILISSIIQIASIQPQKSEVIVKESVYNLLE